MKLVVDNRDTDIVYADKINFQSANDVEVLKIVNISTSNKIKDIVNVLAAGTNMSKEAINLLYVINTCPAYSTIAEIFDSYVCTIRKSRSTFDRGLAELKGKGIIKVNINNQILLAADYNCRNADKNVKYLVIELNANDTSAGISI